MKRLLWISFSMLLAATGWAATNGVPLTATQVLDEFAKTQDRLLSMAYTATTTEEAKKGNVSFDPQFTVSEVRTDANRAASRQRIWGRGLPSSPSQADPWLYITVSDGNTQCRYSVRGKRSGILNIEQVRAKRGSPDSARRAVLNYDNAGYLFGDFGGDVDRCDLMLKNAFELRVRNQPEPVKGVPCLVIEARRTTSGVDTQYTLWFDPAHGYHIAQADVRAGPNGASPAAVFRVNEVEFRQMDGVWVPTSAEADTWLRLPDGSVWSSKMHTRITAIWVNPKDKPVNVFGLLNDVPDGSRVQLVGDAYHKKGKLQNGRYVDAAGNIFETLGTWQKGRAVDAAGNVLWTPESLGGIATNKPPESGRTGGTDKPTSAGKK